MNLKAIGANSVHSRTKEEQSSVHKNCTLASQCIMRELIQVSKIDIRVCCALGSEPVIVCQ